MYSSARLDRIVKLKCCSKTCQLSQGPFCPCKICPPESGRSPKREVMTPNDPEFSYARIIHQGAPFIIVPLPAPQAEQVIAPPRVQSVSAADPPSLRHPIPTQHCNITMDHWEEYIPTHPPTQPLTRVSPPNPNPTPAHSTPPHPTRPCKMILGGQCALEDTLVVCF